MPNREDETWLNTHLHPETCSCPECLRKRKRIKYEFPAEFECPFCGNISVWFSDEKQEYRCKHPTCEQRGKTLEEMDEKKAKIDKQLNDLWK